VVQINLDDDGFDYHNIFEQGKIGFTINSKVNNNYLIGQKNHILFNHSKFTNIYKKIGTI